MIQWKFQNREQMVRMVDDFLERRDLSGLLYNYKLVVPERNYDITLNKLECLICHDTLSRKNLRRSHYRTLHKQLLSISYVY